MGSNQDQQPAPPLGRILVVEDDAILALSIEDALLAAGAVHVTVCPTVALAMAELERNVPDGIVLDVHLADSNDGWALAELVPLIGTRRPRIVFSTAAPEEIPAHIAAVGPVLAKPYDPAELVAALRAPPRQGLIARLKASLR